MPVKNNNRFTIIVVVAVVLLVLIFASTFMGCSCKRWSFENFEDGAAATSPAATEVVPKPSSDPAEPPASSDMSPKEKELFENLKDNKLSDEEINKLVKAGVLTEKLVEKFLEKLQTDDGVVEGFTSVGPKYGCAMS